MLRTLPLGRVTFNSPRFRAMRKKATPTVKKAKQDRAQALAVEKHVRMIRVAMRGGDEAEISRLCKQATKAGVSSAVIDRALERSRTRDSLQELLYEGTLPDGVCVLIEILTDNPKRTAPRRAYAMPDDFLARTLTELGSDALCGLGTFLRPCEGCTDTLVFAQSGLIDARRRSQQLRYMRTA